MFKGILATEMDELGVSGETAFALNADPSHTSRRGTNRSSMQPLPAAGVRLAVVVALCVGGIALLPFGPGAKPQSAPAAQLPELKLYGLALSTATVPEFLQAAGKAGVRLISRADRPSTTLEFDAAAAGVPGLERFELERAGNDILYVRFQLSKDPDVEVQFRKMLEAKYGAPSGNSQRFTESYFKGQVQWHFANEMTLIYDRPFMDEPMLTYLNSVKFERAEADAKLQAAKVAKEASKTHEEKF